MEHEHDGIGFAVATADHPLPETLAEAARRVALIERRVASIERAVCRRTVGGVRDLRVEISDDGVLLEGHCSTYYCKQLAQTAAMAVFGSGQLTNHIEVL